MPRQTPKDKLHAITEIVASHPGSVTAREIADALEFDISPRTLQHWLKQLVDEGRLSKEGERRWAKYRLPPIIGRASMIEAPDTFAASIMRLSDESVENRAFLRQPPEAREPIGYNREFLDSYRPNVSFYLSPSERAHLAEIGKPKYFMPPAGANTLPVNVARNGEFHIAPAGTYAKQILNRLLIELSWNSSRLEGNTYSLLDTRRLIEFGEEAKGRDRREAQMILNHKDAIEFLISAAKEIGFNRYTILNLHAILANNLLQDEAAAGRLRHIPVGIEKSAFKPLENPQLIEECFDQILATTAAIKDPFEQAFFVMVHLPYLQPFDDVNKRVSRLAANIPFIKTNLTPLSFTDVPRDIYLDAVLCVYELNRVSLLKDVFIWAYERTAKHYAAVRQSLGEPDPFRLKHRLALRELVREIIRGRMNRKASSAYIVAWMRKKIAPAEQTSFREIAEGEILGLHEGNFARYRVTPSEFFAWREVWAQKPP